MAKVQKKSENLTPFEGFLLIMERICGAILELVAAFTRILSITGEEVLETVVNESDELTYICELNKFKMLSQELLKLSPLFKVDSITDISTNMV